MEQYVRQLDDLRARIGEAGSLLVAFSGGVDSSFLAAVAHEVLGDRAVALTAASASHPARDMEDARGVAAAIGVRHVVVRSRELEDPRYAENPRNRCFFCKSELFAICRRVADEMGLARIADGCTADDRTDFRPGRDAAREAGVWSPLDDVGMGKPAIRRLLAEVYRLPVAAKPASPCLASRFPYGTAITEPRLRAVEAVEEAVRAAGVEVVRARFHGDVVRLEVEPASAPLLLADPGRAAIVAAARAAGFRFVTLDLEPFGSGRLNRA